MGGTLKSCDLNHYFGSFNTYNMKKSVSIAPTVEISLYVLKSAKRFYCCRIMDTDGTVIVWDGRRTSDGFFFT